MTTPIPVAPPPTTLERLKYVQSIMSVAALELDDFGHDLCLAIARELGRIIREIESEEISAPRNDPLHGTSHHFDDGEHLVEEQIDR